MGIWDVFWTLIWGFFFVVYVFVVVMIVIDLFRDHTLNGWWKALWIVFLVFVPLLTALVYLVVRGGRMAQRVQPVYDRVTEGADVAPPASRSAATEIARAKELLDAGAITEEEFGALKSRALGDRYSGTR